MSVTLASVDLNLLVALDALVGERSVTRAAARTGVTQSAMSHTLRRLRDLFGDPLLVRSGSGMVLTPRAESLVRPLRSALTDLERLVSAPAAFEPARARRTFRLTSPDLFDVLVLPPLLARLERDAPGVDIAVAPAPADLAAALETGDVAVAVVPVLLDADPVGFGPTPGAELMQRTLFEDGFACFLRDGHPALPRRGTLSATRFCGLRHLVVSTGDASPGVVDRALEAHGLARRVALRVPQFATALSLVAHTDLALTAPRSLALVPGAASLVSRAPPVPLPAHAITMVWHPRFGEDPGHRWFRQTLAEVAPGSVAG